MSLTINGQPIENSKVESFLKELVPLPVKDITARQAQALLERDGFEGRTKNDFAIIKTQYDANNTKPTLNLHAYKASDAYIDKILRRPKVAIVENYQSESEGPKKEQAILVTFADQLRTMTSEDDLKADPSCQKGDCWSIADNSSKPKIYVLKRRPWFFKIVALKDGRVKLELNHLMDIMAKVGTSPEAAKKPLSTKIITKAEAIQLGLTALIQAKTGTRLSDNLRVFLCKIAEQHDRVKEGVTIKFIQSKKIYD